MPLAISKARLRSPKPFLQRGRGWRNLFRRLCYSLRNFLQREPLRH